MIRVGILISGGGSNMDRLIAAMQDKGFAYPALVISNNPNAAGLQKAANRGVPNLVISHRDYAPKSAFEAALRQALLGADVDIICLAGFMRVLSAEFLENWQGRVLNIHPSLLPKYRGLNTHQRAIDAGDTHHGCTVHVVVPELDAGPILGQAPVPIHQGDTEETLAARVLGQEHQLYPYCLREFCEAFES